MPQEQQTEKQDALRLEFEASRVAFHDLLDSLSAADFKKKSLNSSWTNGELLFHIVIYPKKLAVSQIICHAAKRDQRMRLLT